MQASLTREANNERGVFMSQGLISVGAGIASFAGGVVFTAMSRDLRMVPMTGLIVGILSLAARSLCLEDGQKLGSKDWILIGGASVVGALSGAATLTVVAILTQGVFIGTMAGSLFGTMLGNLVTFPLRIACILSGGYPYHELPSS
jgi:hypothetical protein